MELYERILCVRVTLCIAFKSADFVGLYCTTLVSNRVCETSLFNVITLYSTKFLLQFMFNRCRLMSIDGWNFHLLEIHHRSSTHTNDQLSQCIPYKIHSKWSSRATIARTHTHARASHKNCEFVYKSFAVCEISWSFMVGPDESERAVSVEKVHTCAIYSIWKHRFWILQKHEHFRTFFRKLNWSF